MAENPESNTRNKVRVETRSYDNDDNLMEKNNGLKKSIIYRTNHFGYLSIFDLRSETYYNHIEHNTDKKID